MNIKHRFDWWDSISKSANRRRVYDKIRDMTFDMVYNKVYIKFKSTLHRNIRNKFCYESISIPNHTQTEAEKQFNYFRTL